MADELAEPADLFPAPVHQQLASLRAAKGLSMEDVAGETRIPLRHLHAIEAGEFDALPSPTYAVGFVRAFARVVDGDEVALAAQVRDEIGLPSRSGKIVGRGASVPVPEPSRVPPRAFAWTTAGLSVLVLGGFLVWRSVVTPDLPMAAALNRPPDATAPVAAPAPAPVTPSGEVVLIATDEVWLRVRDGSGTTLVARTFQPGERFAVPAQLTAPTVTVGRPEALTVTVGGREVAPLGPAGRAVTDVPITATALGDRGVSVPG